MEQVKGGGQKEKKSHKTVAGAVWALLGSRATDVCVNQEGADPQTEAPEERCSSCQRAVWGRRQHSSHFTDVETSQGVSLIHLLHILHFGYLAHTDLHYHAQVGLFSEEKDDTPVASPWCSPSSFHIPTSRLGFLYFQSEIFQWCSMHRSLCLPHLPFSSLKPGLEKHPKANLTSPAYAQKHFLMPCADTTHVKLFVRFSRPFIIWTQLTHPALLLTPSPSLWTHHFRCSQNSVHILLVQCLPTYLCKLPSHFGCTRTHRLSFKPHFSLLSTDSSQTSWTSYRFNLSHPSASTAVCHYIYFHLGHLQWAWGPKSWVHD